MLQENLPTTERFCWKLRDFFFSGEQDFSSFVRSKKKKLLSDLNSQEQIVDTTLSLLPSPWSMKNMERASARVVQAIKKQESIFIFGDYDVDGTTSCAMLYEFFNDLGVQVSIYIPERLVEGYGLNPIGLKNCADQGANLIITVDNGISAVTACDLAKDLGVDIIVTDHHDLPEILPTAFAILNPKQTDCSFGHENLAGVGVAFYLMIAVRSLLKKENPNLQLNLKYFLDYVAIGTIADMATLVGINHVLCKIGLEVLNKNLADGLRIGLHELLVLSGWDQHSAITAGDVGFKIGPRLNAAGRLGNALNSVNLMKTKNKEEAKNIAEFLHKENFERQQLEKTFTKEALLLCEDYKKEKESSFVLHKEEWHPGVVGLVASRVLEKHYKPTLVFGTWEGKLKGSGRSTHAFNLFAALNEVRSEFISFGGHYHAVGITLDPAKLSWLQNYLNEKVRENVSVSDRTPVLIIDGILSLPMFSLNFVKMCEDIEPFGVQNPTPKWLVGPVSVRHVKRIGKDHSLQHAKINIVDGRSSCFVTAFGMAEKFERYLENGMDIYLVVELKRKFWNSQVFLDVGVIDSAPVVYLEKPNIGS